MNDQLNIELSKALEPYRSAIEATIEPYIKIELSDNNKPTWWQSKFGGLPYLPKNFEYPRSYAGEYLYLLAQINFTEVPPIEGLPDRGILQFYVANDDLWGLDFDNPTQQDKFRIIYFPHLELSEKDLITDFSFLATETDFALPIEGCCAIKFSVNYAPLSASDYQFNLFDISSDDHQIDPKFDEYWQKFDSSGHKILGYPYFTQDDPRHNLAETEPLILLFQMDSDSNNNGCEIMWGDNGIGNFFIKQSDLVKLDFTHVLYNWDCC